jgi:predicted amidohydrolase YtcJ
VAESNPSVLLRNVRISGSSDAIVDVAVENGVIASITAAAASTSEPTSSVELAYPSIDLHGRWLTPGLWDNHVHFSQLTLGSRRMDISAAGSAKEAAAMVGSVMGAVAPDTQTPFIAVGFRDGLWPDVPNLGDLDRAVGDRAVVLVSADLHAVWLSSAALALYGLSGHPTGLFREDPAFEITRRIDEVPAEIVDGWARDAATQAAARGVVGIVDYEMAWNLDTWTRRIASGITSLRVEFGVYSEHLDRAIALGLRTGSAIEGTDLLTVGHYKVLTDGSLNTRTAYCDEEYPGLAGHEHPNGLLTVPPTDLLPLMRRAADAGITPAVHAIGDGANALALDAFEELGIGGRIEHAQLLRASDLVRFAQLGVIASVQPEHALDDRDVADKYWAGRTSRAFPLRSLLDSGAQLALGSDAPVAPLDPWITIAAAVGRTRGDREPWHPEQAITIDEAIAASSRTTIAVGQRADIVVTDSDPRTMSASDLRRMSVAATLLGGRFTHNTLG